MLLTDSKIRNAKPKKKEYRLADGESLYLLVKLNGSKLWHFRYEFAEKSKTLSIGKYPGISLAEARDQKHEAKKLLRKNIDPSANKQQERSIATYKANNTFEKLAREWHEHKTPLWSSKYAANTIRRAEIHIFPHIGSRAIADITPLEVLAVVQKLEVAGKTDMSHRVLEIMNSVFRRASITGRVDRNPATDLVREIIPHQVEHHPAITEQEIPKFLEALDNLRCYQQYTKYAFWLLLLTGVRQCELRYSKKSDIDFDAKEWRLRPEVTKMKRVHIVALSTQAIVVLRKLFELTEFSEWLVPSQRTRVHPVMSENTINQMIDRMGYKGRIVGHGFRSLFSTTLNDHGFDSKIIDRQLAHVGRDKIEAAYNRAEYTEKRKEIMQWWGDFLDSQRPLKKRFSSNGYAIEGSFAQPLQLNQAAFNPSIHSRISPTFQPTALSPSFTGLGYAPL